MTSPSSHRDALERILEEADAQMQDIDGSPFTSPAFSALKEKTNEYITQLVLESVRVSKRYKTDTVSEVHVKQANEHLISGGSNRISRHLGTIGGILLGASLSNILAMTAANQFPPVGALSSIVLAMIGTFTVAFHIAKDQ